MEPWSGGATERELAGNMDGQNMRPVIIADGWRSVPKPDDVKRISHRLLSRVLQPSAHSEACPALDCSRFHTETDVYLSWYQGDPMSRWREKYLGTSLP